MRSRRFVPELVCIAHGFDRNRRRLLVSSVDICEKVSLRDGLPALHVAHHPDRVVDVVVLRPATCSELESRKSHTKSAETCHDPAAWSRNLSDDRRNRERSEVRVATLCSDPALVDS